MTLIVVKRRRREAVLLHVTNTGSRLARIARLLPRVAP
jgi:hypothetical protein